MQRISGFTLIESMAVLAVIAVALAAGVPALASLHQSTGAANAHHLLTSSLAIARMSAIQRGSPVTVCPSRDGTSCRGNTIWDDGWIVFVDPDPSGQPSSVSAVLQRIHPIGQGLSLRSTSGRIRVRFAANGWASGSNLSVRLCSRSDRMHLGSVVVNNAGRPRSQRYQRTPCPYAP